MPDDFIDTLGLRRIIFFKERRRQNRDGKIFESIDLSFIPIDSTGGVPNDNIEEPNTFGYRITPEKNIEEPEKWVITSAEQGGRQHILGARPPQ